MFPASASTLYGIERPAGFAPDGLFSFVGSHTPCQSCQSRNFIITSESSTRSPGCFQTTTPVAPLREADDTIPVNHSFK